MAASSKVLIPRFSAGRVAQALQDTPVVMVTGPRQAGKTTLVREFVTPARAYVTLDDDTVLAGVRADPATRPGPTRDKRGAGSTGTR